MQKSITYISYLLFCIIAISCKFNTSNTIENTTELSLKDTIPYSIFSLDTIDVQCKSKYKNCPSAKITYPIFSGADKSINNFLNNEISKTILYKSDTSNYSSISDLIQSYFNDNKEMKKHGDYDDESSAWEIEKNVNVLNKINQYITLAFTNFGYTGGAHPYSSVVYKNYNLLTKQPIKINELLNLNDTALLRIGEHYFRKNNEINDTTKLADAMYFIFGEGNNFEDGPNYGKFHFNDNFALTKDGIEFQYNEYEMSPYVAGAPSFTIPYEKIIPYLKIKVW